MRLRGSVVVLVVVVAVSAGVDTGRSEPSGTRWEIRDLATSGGPASAGGFVAEPVAINDRGQVILRRGFRTEWLKGTVRSFVWEAGRTTDLGSLGGSITEAVAINEPGQVVGVSTTSTGELHGFLWDDGRMRDLGNLGRLGQVVDINERGQVVGYGYFPGVRRAFLWQGDRVRKLRLPPGTTESSPTAINDRGQIVGLATSVDGVWPRVRKAVRWAAGRVAVLQGFWAAVDINEHGDVIGYGARDGRQRRPLLLRNGRLIRLDVLECADCSRVIDAAVVVNDEGAIAGVSEAPPLGHEHAVLWNAGPGRDHLSVRDLGTLGGSRSSTSAISGHRQVIGDSAINDDSAHPENVVVHAFVWESGSISDLGGLPDGTGSHATAINDHNQIVGLANTHTGQPRAVLWTKKRA